MTKTKMQMMFLAVVLLGAITVLSPTQITHATHAQLQGDQVTVIVHDSTGTEILNEVHTIDPDFNAFFFNSECEVQISIDDDGLVVIRERTFDNNITCPAIKVWIEDIENQEFLAEITDFVPITPFDSISFTPNSIHLDIPLFSHAIPDVTSFGGDIHFSLIDPSEQLVDICHKGKKTMSVPPEQVAKHLAHDDTLGPCT